MTTHDVFRLCLDYSQKKKLEPSKGRLYLFTELGLNVYFLAAWSLHWYPLWATILQQAVSLPEVDPGNQKSAPESHFSKTCPQHSYQREDENNGSWSIQREAVTKRVQTLIIFSSPPSKYFQELLQNKEGRIQVSLFAPTFLRLSTWSKSFQYTIPIFQNNINKISAF